MVSRMSAAGAFANRTKLKYDVIREANDFAASKGKMAEGIVWNETLAAPGQLPSFEYQFRLVNRDSAGSGRQAVSSSATHIEIDR